jgi:hypothetical protein
MTKNTFGVALYQAVPKAILSDPQLAVRLATTVSRVNAGLYDSDFLDVLGQSHRQEQFSLYDAFVLTSIERAVEAGVIRRIEYPLSGNARRNSLQTQNQAVLDQLPVNLCASFHGHPGDNDGAFVFSAGGTEALTLPLEVGTTDFATTWGHLNYEGGLSRWPYGQRRLTVLVRSDLGSGHLQERPETQFVR